ncbi:MAG: replication/maintenance protein RepL [Bacteroidaceae bacterium]|nr:replication/maintenance protein RepL [Bacteroidaceae bacterium]
MGKNELTTKTTTKKVKCVGTEQFINTATGEIEDFQVTQIEERDFNFSKVWIRNFVATLDLVGNQKTKLVYWIIDHLNKENQLIYTNRQLESETGISLKTVSITMKALQDANFLKKQFNGVYIINPDILFKGSKNARMNVLNQYSELGYQKAELSKEERISNLKQSISTLQHQLDELLSDDKNIIDAEVEAQMSFTPSGQIFQRVTEVKKK